MKLSAPQVAAFTETYRCRSFTRAALALGLTQSAVTQHVAKLERRMGTRLFLRHRSGLEPTKPAHELFALTDRLRTLEALIGEKLDSYGSVTEGHLSVIANAPRPALPLIAAFARRHPGIRLEFALMSWTLAMQRIEAREADVAIVTEPRPSPALVIQELARAPFVALMRRDHRLAASRRLRLADLARESVILPERGSLTQQVVADALAKSGATLHRVTEMTSFPLVKEAVLQGVGIGVILGDSVSPALELVERRLVEIERPYRTCLVTPEDKHDLRFVRAFMDVAAA